MSIGAVLFGLVPVLPFVVWIAVIAIRHRRRNRIELRTYGLTTYVPPEIAKLRSERTLAMLNDELTPRRQRLCPECGHQAQHHLGLLRLCPPDMPPKRSSEVV